jgi:asparagine synthase (glutamine-hydrolysing)
MSRLRSEGIVDASSVRSAWRDHLSGRRNLQYQLWDVLMLQAWLERAQPSRTPSRGGDASMRPVAGSRPKRKILILTGPRPAAE